MNNKTSGNLRADLYRAISQPDAYLERFENETLAGQQHRAVMAVLTDHGIDVEERPTLRENEGGEQ